MNTLIALRLDNTLDAELDKKASALGISKSKLVRDAIVDYLPRVKAVAKSPKAVAAKKEPKAKQGKTAKTVLVKKAVKAVAKNSAKPSKKSVKKSGKAKK